MVFRVLVSLARGLHVLSAFWVLILAFWIVGDVLGRAILSSPIRGTSEVIRNSVVAITFMQLPLAVFSGSMLRTELASGSVGMVPRRLLRTGAFILGAIMFGLIAWSSWGSAITAFNIGEYEGEGALRVPTWPVRFLLIGTSVYAAIAYLGMIWLDWTDQLAEETYYPGALSFGEPATTAQATTAPEGR